MNKRFRKFFLQMIHYNLMKYIFALLLSLPLLSLNLNAEYEMHIPNCTQKGVENCGGFLFDNETGDVLFCGSESCIDLKLPKSWKAKQSDKQSKHVLIVYHSVLLSKILVVLNRYNSQNHKKGHPQFHYQIKNPHNFQHLFECNSVCASHTRHSNSRIIMANLKEVQKYISLSYNVSFVEKIF